MKDAAVSLTYKTHTPRHPGLGIGPIPVAPSIDPAWFEAEREAVYRRSWLIVGRVERIPNPGDFFVREIAVCSTQVLVVRGRDGVVRAFHNICKHRGNPITWDAQGTCRGRFVCRFHGWAYDTDGRLAHMTDAQNFWTGEVDRATLDLTPIRLDEWQGFLFVHLAPGPKQTLREFLGPLAGMLATYPFREITKREFWTIDERVNWKVLLDAQLEGWHVPFLHAKSLARSTAAAGMVLRHSVMEAHGEHAIIGVDPPPAYTPSPVGEVSMRHGLGVFDGFAFTRACATDPDCYPLRGSMNLYFFFPNVIMGLMRDCYWMYNVWPLAVDRSAWEIGVNTVPPRNAGERFMQEYNKVGLRDTLMEDSVTHERVQPTLASGGIEHFHFQDEELALRNFHHAVDARVAAWRGNRG